VELLMLFLIGPSFGMGEILMSPLAGDSLAFDILLGHLL
jgi:hypothetical protein